MSYVQQSLKVTTGGANSITTGGITTTVGNTVFLTGSHWQDSVAHTTSFSQNKGGSNTIANDISDIDSLNECRSSVASMPVVAGGSGHTFTMTDSVGDSAACMVLHAVEFSGMNNSSLLDVTVAAERATSGTTLTATTPTTGQANAVAIACFTAATGSSSSNISNPPTNWSSIGVENNSPAIIGAQHSYRILSSISTYAATWNWTGSTQAAVAVIAVYKEAGGASYTLGAAQGSYSLSGQATGLRLARRITAAQGSYSLSGQAALLKRSYPLVAAQGSYSLSGQAAVLRLARKISAAQGAYALSGQSAGTVRGLRITAAQGAYSLTGQDVGLSYSGGARVLTAAQGSYSLTGQAVGIKAARTIAAAQGSYALTGFAQTLRADRRMQALQGSYALTGNAALVVAARKIVAAMGSYAFSGFAAGLIPARRITLANGAYALTGNPASITYSGVGAVLSAATGSYTLTGFAVTLEYVIPTRAPAGPGPTLIAPGTSRPPVISAARPGNINTRRPGNSSGRRS